jgi:hypothetical protein
MDEASIVKPRISPVFKEYEDGKHRRYELLFKVNGAAFAIVSLAAEAKASDFVYQVIGLRTLAFGLAAFCVVMGLDICTFGLKMRKMNAEYWQRIDGRQQETPAPKTDLAELFAWPGKAVLLAIVALLVIGWCLVAVYAPCHPLSSATPSKE